MTRNTFQPRLYVRPRDIELTAPNAALPCGVVRSIHRTATGRRAQVSLGAADTLIDVELECSAEVKAGAKAGLRFRCGRIFEAKAG